MGSNGASNPELICTRMNSKIRKIKQFCLFYNTNNCFAYVQIFIRKSLSWRYGTKIKCSKKTNFDIGFVFIALTFTNIIPLQNFACRKNILQRVKKDSEFLQFIYNLLFISVHVSSSIEENFRWWEFFFGRYALCFVLLRQCRSLTIYNKYDILLS